MHLHSVRLDVPGKFLKLPICAFVFLHFLHFFGIVLPCHTHLLILLQWKSELRRDMRELFSNFHLTHLPMLESL